jgi:hypothetical protein
MADEAKVDFAQSETRARAGFDRVFDRESFKFPRSNSNAG